MIYIETRKGNQHKLRKVGDRYILDRCLSIWKRDKPDSLVVLTYANQIFTAWWVR